MNILRTLGLAGEKEIDDSCLEQLALAKGIDYYDDPPGMNEWVSEKIDCLKSLVPGIVKTPDDVDRLHVNWDKVEMAFEDAFLFHYGQKRKVGKNVMYVEHLAGSVEQYLGMKKEEYDFCDVPSEKVDLTTDFIKLILHDSLEDFAEATDLDKEEKSRFFYLINKFIREKYGESVADFVELATKFTARPEIKIDLAELEFDKMDLSRVDFVSLILGVVYKTRSAVNLLLKAAERHDNLETVGLVNEPDRKAMETYNLALACYAGRFRTPGKMLFGHSFAYLYYRDDQELYDDFRHRVELKQQADHDYYESVRGRLEASVESVIGKKSPYRIYYSPLPDWRVHELLVSKYLKEKKQASNGLHKLTPEILEDEVFQEIIHDTFLGRIVIEAERTFQAIRLANADFDGFNKEDSKFNAGMLNFVDPRLLDLSGYTSYRTRLVDKEVFPDSEERVEKVIEVKIISKRLNHDNEFGEMEYRDGEKGMHTEYYSYDALRKFAEYLKKKAGIKNGRWTKCQEILTNPAGGDIGEVQNEIRALVGAVKDLNIFPFVHTRKNYDEK